MKLYTQKYNILIPSWKKTHDYSKYVFFSLRICLRYPSTMSCRTDSRGEDSVLSLSAFNDCSAVQGVIVCAVRPQPGSQHMAHLST